MDYAQFEFSVRAACLENDSQAVLLIRTPAVRALLTRSASRSLHKHNLFRPPSPPDHVLEKAAGIRTHSVPLLFTRVLPFHALLGPFPFRCPVRMNPEACGMRRQASLGRCCRSSPSRTQRPRSLAAALCGAGQPSGDLSADPPATGIPQHPVGTADLLQKRFSTAEW